MEASKASRMVYILKEIIGKANASFTVPAASWHTCN
jgi:hypothetical protein